MESVPENRRRSFSIPSWTASNAFLSEQNLLVATTCYFPFIRATPTDLTTIYTILLRLVQIAEKLDQSHILVTADCVIYSKDQQILGNKSALLDGNVTMGLGDMPLNMAYIASIGKLFGDGGLLSMLVDSDVYAPTWMQQRDQTDLRRNDMDKLVRDIQQAFVQETGNPLDYYPNS